MKKLLSAVLSASLITSCVVLPAGAADKKTETITYRYDNGNWVHTREMEKLGRGLVAIKSGSDVYLSWRLLDSEDHIFGSANKNVSFNIYSGSNKIGTVADKTNYTVTGGDINAVYSVAPVIDGAEGAKETAIRNMENDYFDIDLSDYTPERQYLPRTISLLASDGKGYNFIASKDAPETIPANTYAADVNYYVSDLHDENTAYQYYYYTINDCSVGDVDGDGEYEIIVKWDCNGQDNSQGGVTGDVILDAYEMDGTQLWRINLGKNIRAGAHYTQFLVYDFDGDGKAEMTCKTAPGSKDSKGEYVTKKSHVNEIKSISDTINETDYRAGSGFIVTGDEYLTVFNGATGEAMDTIYYPNQRIDPYLWGDRLQDGGGNRVDRFTAAVAYIDGVKPYAVYMRGYYMHQSGGNSERQAACAVSFDGTRLDCKYSFDTYDAGSYKNDTSHGSRDSHSTTMTRYSSYRSDGSYKGVNGYVAGNEAFVGEGNHNCAVADVDNDGKDEVMTGALCYELKDNGILGVKWCTFLEHGDALHIGDYDPTHRGHEFFNVQEDSGPNSNGGSEVAIGYGMTVVDPGVDSINTTGSAYNDLIMFRESASGDTGRGVMANIGMGGYYQFWSSKNTNLYISNGGTNFSTGSKKGLAQNFRIFWDGDLYDELLDGVADDDDVSITSYNTTSKTIEQLLLTEGCATANSTKKTPALTADIFGDWREELIVRKDDNSGLRVYSTTTPSDYKIKTLMQDPVYRSGVAAEQTAYNQPPHIGFYLAEEAMKGNVTAISIKSTKNSYKVGENIDKATLTVTATYKNGESADITDFEISGYNPLITGEQTVTVLYQDKSAEFKVNVTTGFTANSDGYITGYSGASSAVLPTAINGTAIKGISANALTSSGLSRLTIYDDTDIASGALPSGITLVCFENSAAHKYAVANGIKYELLKPVEYLADVTYEESEYSNYSLIADLNSVTVGPITYNPGKRNASETSCPFYKVTGEDGNSYLRVNVQRFASKNREGNLTFNISELAQQSEFVFSMDYQIQTNTKGMKILISDTEGTEITQLTNTSQLSDNGWYHLELSYSNGTYTEKVTDNSGNVILLDQLSGKAVGKISFPVTGEVNTTNYVYLDNISISTPLISHLTFNVEDINGAPVNNASVTMNGETKNTDKDGVVSFELEAGRYAVNVTHSELTDYSTSIVAYSKNQFKKITMDSALPSQNYEVISVTGETVKVNVPKPEDVKIYAAKYSANVLTNIIELFPMQTYSNTFNAIGFEPDAVYIWSTELTPLAVWRKTE